MPAGLSFADFAPLMPEFVLTGVALVVLLADAFVPRTKHAFIGWLSIAGLVLTAIVLLPYANDHGTAARGMVAIDGFGAFFKFLFLLAAVLTILMSPRYLDIEGARPGTYYFLILCATLGMMFMASGIDLVTIFIGLETMAISFYILAGFIKPNRRSNEAAVKYFLLGCFSLGLLLYGMSILYGLTATTNLRTIATLLVGDEHHAWLPLAVILVVAGVGFKIAAVPFHMWAPDVYEGAPTPITAFLSVGSKAAAFAMLLRIFFEGLLSVSADWGMLFYALAILTMTVGNVAALTQSNVKRMLAYSSIAHAGYLLIGVVAATRVPQIGIKAALIYLMIYAFMQFGAFAVVDPAAPEGRHRRGTEGHERPVPAQPAGRHRHAALHAVARRHPADGRLHGQVLAVQRRHRRRVLLARRDRRPQQRDLPLLLPARRRLHVVQGRADRVRPGDLAGHGHPARDHDRRDRGHRRLPAAAVRPGRRLRQDARRRGHYRNAAIARRGRSAPTRHARRSHEP